jgi:hypothetical protein
VGDTDRISNIESGKELFRAANPAIIPPQSLRQCVPYRLEYFIICSSYTLLGVSEPSSAVRGRARR